MSQLGENRGQFKNLHHAIAIIYLGSQKTDGHLEHPFPEAGPSFANNPRGKRSPWSMKRKTSKHSVAWSNLKSYRRYVNRVIFYGISWFLHHMGFSEKMVPGRSWCWITIFPFNMAILVQAYSYGSKMGASRIVNTKNMFFKCRTVPPKMGVSWNRGYPQSSI
jgi:hypothetical protein